MTSMISPWLHASQLASQAQDRLATAASLVRSTGPRPFEPTPIRIGIPEQNGPDTPDNPWFVAPKPIMPPYLPNSAALRLAGGAVTAIDQALALGPQLLSKGVTLAFQHAKDEAVAGVRVLQSPNGLPMPKDGVATSFDAAGMWLGLAKNLLSLQHGTPNTPVRPPVVHPPVTIQPVPGPGEPGSPITVEPITIQLPSPDSEIQ